jgi:hypothetical protein
MFPLLSLGCTVTLPVTVKDETMVSQNRCENSAKTMLAKTHTAWAKPSILEGVKNATLVVAGMSLKDDKCFNPKTTPLPS